MAETINKTTIKKTRILRGVEVESGIFVMIKPWVLGRNYFENPLVLDNIIKDVESKGSVVTLSRVYQIPRECIEQQYEDLSGQTFYNAMIQDHVNQSALIGVVEGDPSLFKTFKKEIREKYKSLVVPSEHYNRDVLHSSDSFSEYQKDIEIWRNFLW